MSQIMELHCFLEMKFRILIMKLFGNVIECIVSGDYKVELPQESLMEKNHK